MKLAERVSAALARATEKTGRDLFHEPLVLGVSGGADSLVLLHLLRAVRPAEGLIVAHLDHALRPSSADEAAVVNRIAAGYGLRFHTRRVDVAELAKSLNLSLEEAARMARYDFLAEIARAEGAPAVAVGHHADDQVETILMHVLRGSGLGGLRGMVEAGELPGHPKLRLLRPLLAITRAEIEAYAGEQGLRPITDESNADPAFLRNRVRHELLPALETYNPQIRERLRALSEVVAADEAFLVSQTTTNLTRLIVERGEETLAWSRDGWLALPLALRRRVLRLALAVVASDAPEPGYQALEAARRIAESGETGARVDLPGGLALRVAYDRLRLTRQPGAVSAELPQLPSAGPIPLSVPGAILLKNGWRLSAEFVVGAPDIETNTDRWTAYVAIPPAEALLVRGRRPGDRIRPLGLGGERKVKEVMIDRKVPVEARALWPVVATAERVVWLAGLALDDRARVTLESSRVIRLRCWREEHEAG
jgi:tRNA(Ile)-lysidine synthase